MGEGLGWGCPLNFSRDTFGRAIRVPERVPIANTQNPITLRIEPSVSFSVVQLSFRQIVPTAIDFDHQLRAVVDEIDDVAAHRSLPPDV